MWKVHRAYDCCDTGMTDWGCWNSRDSAAWSGSHGGEEIAPTSVLGALAICEKAGVSGRKCHLLGKKVLFLLE